MIIGGGLFIPGYSSCTLNPSDKNSAITLSGGNLTASTGTGSSWVGVRATKGISSGKFYWEVKLTTAGDSGCGVCNVSESLSAFPGFSTDTNGWGYYNYNGIVYHAGAGATYTAADTGDTIQHALDMGAGTLKMGKNGVWFNSGSAVFTGITGTVYPFIVESGDISPHAALTAAFSQPSWKYPALPGYIHLP